MYIPKIFAIENNTELFEFIDQWSFANLITTNNGELFVNSMPFVIDKIQNKLFGHLAINNPQLALLEKADDLLVSFNGLNSYVSPNWYVSQEMVPSWNFEAVQVLGKAKLVDQNALMDILQKLTEKHERFLVEPWTINKVSDSRLNKMMNMIVGFEIEICSIKGKSKLSQNRSAEDREGVISGLRTQNGNMAQLVADKMQADLDTQI
jgi:transcriptional regulator